MNPKYCMAFLLAVALVLPGCGFAKLGRDLKELDRAATVTFSVTGDHQSGHPVYAVLLRPEQGHNWIETYAVVQNDEPVKLLCTPGEYLLVAIQDINGNSHYDLGEPYACHGNAEPFVLNEGEEATGIELRLSIPADPGAWSPAVIKKDRPNVLAPWLERVGSIVSLDDPRFDEQVTQLGMWEPTRFIMEQNPGLYLLEPYDPDKLPIVLVHGIGGTPRSFKPIIEHLGSERFQYWVFYYPSGLRLDNMGSYLSISMRRLQAPHQPKQIIVIAHSMGGLVAWSGVGHHQRSSEEHHITQLITLASPLGGIPGAASGVEHAPVIMPCWFDLAPGSDFLQALYPDSLEGWPDYAMLAAYDDGSRPLDVSLSQGDGEVPLTSQLHAPPKSLARDVDFIPATHTGILKHPDTLRWLDEQLSGRGQ